MYKNVKVLDVHGHMSTPTEFFHHAALLIASNSPFRKLSIPDDRLKEALQRHLRELDERNVDLQLVGPRPFAMFQHIRPHIQEAWCRTVNDVIAQSVRLYPDRFMGMAQLPQSAELDTSNCVAELERCVREYGFVGAYLNPDPDGNKK